MRSWIILTVVFSALILLTANALIQRNFDDLSIRDITVTSGNITICRDYPCASGELNEIQQALNGTHISSSRIPPPLQQMKSGISTEDIVCGELDGKPLLLFLRIENNNSVCLTLNTANELSHRGWIEFNQTIYNDIVLKKAKEFVLSSHTFTTYGIEKTLLLDMSTCDLLIPQSCYPTAYFYVTHTGNYGNGTNMMNMTNQTAYHSMSMIIYDMNQVQCAIVDKIWDEKNQRPLDKNDKTCY
ncbi:MAG: hypothetical protein HY223_02430 [Thaumarchaeota archaeon]|nr:hypothetical protein [Nitrososphaerota archaeon]